MAPGCISSRPRTSKGSNSCRITDRKIFPTLFHFQYPPGHYCFLVYPLRKAVSGSWKTFHRAIDGILCAVRGCLRSAHYWPDSRDSEGTQGPAQMPGNRTRPDTEPQGLCSWRSPGRPGLGTRGRSLSGKRCGDSPNTRIKSQKA